MRSFLKRFAGDTGGASMVEFSIIAFLVLVVTGGLVDFSHGFYQWNSATKALQLGARLASISDPVDSSLRGWDGLDMPGAELGKEFPDFKRVCTGGAIGSCTDGGIYDSTAMNTIIFGRGQSTCGTIANDRTPAVCDIFRRVRPENITITYEYTGLGFAGRPGGPVPTITVELTGLQFEFVFLNGLLGFGSIDMPAMKTTATGEDMNTCAPDPGFKKNVC